MEGKRKHDFSKARSILIKHLHQSKKILMERLEESDRDFPKQKDLFKEIISCLAGVFSYYGLEGSLAN